MTFQLPCPYSWKCIPQSSCWITDTHLREASGADKNCRGKRELPLASQREELWPPYLASPTHLYDLEQNPLTKNQFLGSKWPHVWTPVKTHLLSSELLHHPISILSNTRACTQVRFRNEIFCFENKPNLKKKKILSIAIPGAVRFIGEEGMW